MKIVVGSDIAHYTRSVGQFDNRMSYVVALRELGHEVVVFSDVYPERCYDSDYRSVAFEDWEGRRDFARLAGAYVDDLSYCLVYDGGPVTDGMAFDEAVAAAESADLLINIGGKLKTPEIVSRIPVRAFVDLAPGKTQVYHQEYDLDHGLEEHHFFFTVGLDIGRPGCDIPTSGVEWHPFKHPVPLSLWPQSTDLSAERFSTISGWRGKETFVYGGRYSGEKSDQWHRFVDVPSRTSQTFEIALNLPAGYDEDAEEFRARGWRLSDPTDLRTLEDYRRFVAGSRGEFTIANQRYTEFRSGWFSERSVRYLATGRPVIMQSTGIEEHIPAGKGLLTFTTVEEAVEAVDLVNDDYRAHCDAARSIAEEHFDGTKVLAELIKVVTS